MRAGTQENHHMAQPRERWQAIWSIVTEERADCNILFNNVQYHTVVKVARERVRWASNGEISSNFSQDILLKVEEMRA